MKEITTNLGDASKAKQRLKDEPLAEEASKQLDEHVKKMGGIYDTLRTKLSKDEINLEKDFRAEKLSVDDMLKWHKEVFTPVAKAFGKHLDPKKKKMTA
eukprot:6532458-Pyramimonas_sp.AAC.1